MKTWQFKESINMRGWIRPRWGMWYYVGNWEHRNRSKGAKFDVLVQYGPGKQCVVLWDGAMRSSVWHLWPWYLADELSVSQGPESLSGFLTSTCFFFYSCHHPSCCPTGAEFLQQKEETVKQLTSWCAGSMRFLPENDILKDRGLIQSHQIH